MTGTNLFRLFITALLILWAVVEITPVRDTPFETFLLEQVTETVDEAGNVVSTRDENRETLTALLGRVTELVEEHRERLGMVEENPYPTVFIGLRRLANNEGIDLARFFQHIRVVDIRNLERRNETLLNELLTRSKGELRLGLDLAGGVAITFEVDPDQLDSDFHIRQQQMADVRAIILDRVDGLGVAEPVVRVKGGNLVEVQMPGISSEDNPNLAETIGAPAVLEFTLLHRTARPGTAERAPLGYVEKEQEIEDRQTGEIIRERVYVRRIPVMTGEIINRARPQITQTGGYEVTMDFNSAGRRQFAEVTRQIAAENTPGNIGRLGILLDGELISSPTVREEINSPSARITGRFTQREAFELANALSNPLAVELAVTEMYEVGPSLAADARDASLRAGAAAGILVIIFMLIYYGVAGIVSTIAVLLNILLVIGALASFGATLTLPGVAALVLTIGMAVDASILIFERAREELLAGKSIKNAVTNGFEKAFSTIIDANVTTLITALILIWLGTGPVQGFGITLAVGILATVFCSLIFMRFLMELLVSGNLLKNPFRFRLIRAEEIPFLNHARKAFAISWVVVALGIVAFILHFDQAFGIDFTGGDEVSVAYEQRLTSIDVQNAAAAAAFTRPDGSTEPFGEVNVFYRTPLGSEREIMIVQTEPGKGGQLFQILDTAYPDAGLERVGETQIGAAVGREVTNSAIFSMLAALLAILLYVAIRFEFGFGLGAITATVHDVLMTVGLFIALGEFFGVGSGQFTAPMIAAVLMTVGYSINDTIVVFDRIREELELNPGTNLRRIVHLSISRVLNRTILTSLTTLFASFTLFLFGAGVIKDFALVFLIGILTGTFSSIFIASPTFFWYHKGDRRKVEKGEILPSYDWTAEPKPKPEESRA